MTNAPSLASNSRQPSDIQAQGTDIIVNQAPSDSRLPPGSANALGGKLGPSPLKWEVWGTRALATLSRRSGHRATGHFRESARTTTTRRQMNTPWAILKCKFNDDNSEPFSNDYYENLFCRAGVGTGNMIDYFRDVSHGNIDLGESRVFGWLTLTRRHSEYTGSGANPAGRYQLIAWARDAAAAAGAPLDDYWGTLVCMNVPTDLFGGGGRQAVCDSNSTFPAQLGQEMGHAYGLSHSRADGSEEDYRDSWDIMSTWNSCYIASDPRYRYVGPGMNACNMRGRGWLDESRVWRGGPGGYDTTIQLRPLYRLDLPGFLAAEVGANRYLVEYRPRVRWDSAIPESTVLL